MANTELMQMLNAFKNLIEELGGTKIIDSIMPDDIVKQLSCVGVLHNQVQFALSLNDLVKLDDSRMPDLLQYFYLSRYSINVHLVLYFVLFQNFNCYFLFRDGVQS